MKTTGKPDREEDHSEIGEFSFSSLLSCCFPSPSRGTAEAQALLADPSSNEPIILITGFGPFNQYKINPSWEAVKALPQVHNGVHIIRKRITVAYADVQSQVPSFLSSHILGHHGHEGRVKAVIHVGVGRRGQFKLEKLARREVYDKPDIHGKLPHKNRAALTPESNESAVSHQQAPKVIHSLAHVEQLKGIMLKQNWKVDVSEDAGLFLCEFIYYTSMYNLSLIAHESASFPLPSSDYGTLDQSPSSQNVSTDQELEHGKNTIPALFVHVPPDGDPYTIPQMTEFLTSVIDYFTRL